MMVFAAARPVVAQELVLSAKVDKTTVAVGEPITLTITVSGDIDETRVSPPQFPAGFAVAARSQSTNFSLRNGSSERSTALLYVLIPQQSGTFHLGPFLIRKGQKQAQTDVLEITVKKTAPPQQLPPPGNRYTL